MTQTQTQAQRNLQLLHEIEQNEVGLKLLADFPGLARIRGGAQASVPRGQQDVAQQRNVRRLVVNDEDFHLG